MSKSGDRPCGPWEGGLNAVVPQVPGDACPVHDDCYTEPDGRSRSTCDTEFERQLLRAEEHPTDGIRTAIYAGSVRLFGWIFYARRWERLKAWARSRLPGGTRTP